ncbi:MAG TPA: hypothetical protein VER03_03200 [Bryobacteraceae bacterium]|nr:hypothetical protein [Bryobacteraceae bacterium]
MRKHSLPRANVAENYASSREGTEKVVAEITPAGGKSIAHRGGAASRLFGDIIPERLRGAV